METTILNKNGPDTREKTRRSFYKTRISKDNVTLDLNSDTPQEERRKLLLEYQKKHREESFNAARNILQNTYFPEVEMKEAVDTKKYHSKSTPKRLKQLIMFSEWMLNVPEDFVSNWIMVPCPKGRRTRIVAGKGITKAYSKKGYQCDRFYSALPGGNFMADYGQYAILDCIWDSNKKVYYALDILSWRIQSFINCEAEFRQYWIDTKINETKELKERDEEKNVYPILPLPRISCDTDLSSALTEIVPTLPSLHGFLFYHRHAHYNFGISPLVTWLKPFMLSEVLGIWVPSPLDEKPQNYVDFEHHINSTIQKKPCLKKVENCMDIVEEN